MRQNEKLWLALGLTGAALWLWFTRSGQAAAQTAGEQIATGAEALTNIINPTRGERNNNPGNIRHSSIVWQGQADDQSDPAFVKYVDPLHGIRAIAHVLRTYSTHYGLNTIADIIARWAPGSENPTDAYIANVSQWIGIDANATINVSDPSVMVPLVKAIINQENGRVSYDDATIAQGSAMI